MTNKEILKADLLEILFEHRNKFYGAYALRKEYNSRLGTALGFALSLVFLIILLSALRTNNEDDTKPDKKDGVVIKIVDMKPIKPDEPEKPKEKIKQVKSINQVVIVPDNMETDMPEQNDIKEAIVGTEDIDGKPLSDPNEIEKSDQTNKGNGEKEAIQAETEPFAPKEVHASFPGGETAWINFLRKFLQAPDELAPGERKEVRVRFWIDENGFISRFEIVQSGGSNFDKEVLRVMKKMPKWEPAMQNGRKVAVAFTQPVTFVGVEE